MLVIRALVSIVVLPAVAAIAIPAYLLRGGASPGGAAWLGAVVIVLGAGLFAWCMWLFAARGRGTLAPWDPPRRFVASGPYRVVRNPMYLAVGTVLIGEAILFGSLALLAWLVAIVLAWHVFVVFYEEPTLERSFGDSYRTYRARVPRWLPRLRRERA